ncbi:ABC transporter ATP-binding protein [Bacillus sp. HMF5848]|uniref:ABC transporter ATP-binding protein n=1 Tax=Bacillus sp. HMF5848 TaxID=2495421 RepID=UPI000F770405|nr:ABC transporter ATP-binding protein [Bacillus sp. HMF5848]RSK28797.1 ABC transporter ATP-binding protein [Bacillus sp. HMF5848]
MSIEIKFDNVIKKYNDQAVIPGLSLNIKKGEFFTLLGPSGCGKTTLLRMVAGFNSIEGGEIFFDNKSINDLKPNMRNIGMVFQNYAIFPHLTVKKNIAFGLENRKVSKTDIDKRVNEILNIVQIEQFKDRLPERLSGGQQQRVALARAIVINPDVLLMDEPLSNLDAKLRIELRNAIKNIQNKVGITTIYVTHDQEEAMAVSDRIAVMKDGTIQHAGTPQNIYHRPANLFVSTFIGRTNILEGSLVKHGEEITLHFNNTYSIKLTNINTNLLSSDKTNVKISVRPEEFIINESTDGEGIKGKVISSTFLGLNTNYFVELENNKVVEIIKESDIDSLLEKGAVVYLQFKPEKINVFNESGEINLTRGVVNDITRYEDEKNTSKGVNSHVAI